MKAIILLGTLKQSGLSNTQTLCEFLAKKMKRADIRCEIVRLVDHHILPGTCSDMGNGDEWPGILQKVLDSDIVIFATPIWWGNQSSEIQRVIERLDEVHDDILADKPSSFEGKTGGIVITGDSDGAEHVIGNLCNFFNAVGLDPSLRHALGALGQTSQGQGHAEEKIAGKVRGETSRHGRQNDQAVAEVRARSGKAACEET